MPQNITTNEQKIDVESHAIIEFEKKKSKITLKYRHVQSEQKKPTFATAFGICPVLLQVRLFFPLPGSNISCYGIGINRRHPPSPSIPRFRGTLAARCRHLHTKRLHTVVNPPMGCSYRPRRSPTMWVVCLQGEEKGELAPMLPLPQGPPCP